MQQDLIDMTAIGNAIVDVLARVEDADLERHGMPKGGMELIDAGRADTLYAELKDAQEVSGGSVANTAVGVTSFGGSAAYIGKVASDSLGESFSASIREAGVRYGTEPTADGPGTGRCIVFVTGDAQRTLNTYLGACVELGPEDIDRDLVARSRVTYLEGYLFDPPRAREAFSDAAVVARAAGRKVSLSLSDTFCVQRHAEAFREFVAQHVDILFANEEEIFALCDTRDLATAVDRVRGQVEVAALTRGEKGALIVKGSEIFEIPARPVASVVDTTGAGDLFAAGFHHGWAQGFSLDRCGELGALAAAEVISHFGARPESDLRKLVD